MFHPVDVHVGRKVKVLRTYYGFTQKFVSDTLKISFQQLQKYETGGNRISASRLYEIAQILNVQVSYFFEGLDGEGEDADATSIFDSESAQIAALIAKIKDNKLKKRIRSLIAELAS